MNKNFFIENRKEFAMKLPDKCAAFIFSGEYKAMSSDTDYRFLVDRNFYYLTGFVRAGAMLLIIRDDSLKNGFEERMYVQDKNPFKERWQGKRPSFEDVELISGIDSVEADSCWDEAVLQIIKDSEYKLALDGSSIMEGPRKLRQQIGGLRNDQILDVSDTLIRMRMVKKPCEIEAITKAAVMTENAVEYMKSFMAERLEHNSDSGDAADLIWPLNETALYTALEYGMARQGSLIPAFETIVAIDDNVFYLHHSDPEDDKILHNGNLIQLDVGARYEGYCADISRAIYVKNMTRSEDDFDSTGEERIIRLHELIVKLRATVYAETKPGLNFKNLNLIVRKVCGDWLVQEGLLDVNYTDEDVSRYYWHNTGHHLGLDVHDVCIKDAPFEAGNVLAIEPGVYIEEWGIGFRIEDDILVTADGCRLLSSGCDSLEDFVFESAFID
ncbi:MAG: Xaa-Pro peptidase family protein [Clostridia bacterium]|nr:Xaa-Pro peptidase family protein [Clostridia bacterium]